MPKKTERRNPLGFSNIHSVAKHQKKCRGDTLRKKNFEKKSEKNVSQCRKKLKGGPVTRILARLPRCRGMLAKILARSCQDLTKATMIMQDHGKADHASYQGGDSLVSPGMICYAEKQVKPFWSSSLGQMVLFDTIIFCRTFKNYFGQFVWIEKKRVTIIVAFHFMKRRLKNRKADPLVSSDFPILQMDKKVSG